MEPGLVGAGLVVGFFVGLTGIGGAALLTPVLIFGVGLAPSVAVGTDLVCNAVTKVAGAWRHARQGTIDLAVTRDLALGSLPATALAIGALAWFRGVASRAEALEQGLARLVGVMLLIAAVLLVLRPRGPVDRGGRGERARTVAVGAAGGLCVGLTSVGSGSVIVALLTLFRPLPTRALVGTDVAHAAILVPVAALGHGFLGTVDLPVALQLTLGSVPGVLFGARLVSEAPTRALRLFLAILLVAAALKLVV